MKDKAAHVHKEHGLERSSKWPRVRAEFMLTNKTCAVCNRMTYLQVHHVLPFHLCILIAKRPELELDPRNLITLCEPPGPESCHDRVGHLGDYRSFNPNVREDAQAILTGVAKGPSLKERPPILAKMTLEERRQFCSMVKKLYGKRSRT